MKTKLKVAHATATAVACAYPPVIGVMGKMALLPVNDIRVDPKYQRGVNRKKAEKIAMTMDWGIFAPVSVSKRPDGSYYAYEGQHRVVAIQMRGDIDLVPCYIVELAGAEEEAQKFSRMNRERTRLKPLEQYRAELVAGEAPAVFVAEMLRVFELEATDSKYCGVGKTNAVSALTAHVKKKKNMSESMREVSDCLTIIRDAWSGQPKAYSGRAVEGVLRMVTRVNDRTRLLKQAGDRLGRYPVEEILDIAKRMSDYKHIPVLSVLPDILIEKLNYRRKVIIV